MPSIEISTGAMDYLKSLAEPFVDTPATVLDRIIDQHRRLGIDGSAATDNSKGARTDYRVETLPPLLHSKIESATIDGRPVTRPKWSVLVEEMVRAAAKKGNNPAQIATSMNANTEISERTDTGFVFIREAGLSFQKMDANRSCKAILGISRRFRIPVSIDFFWRDDPNAHSPGSSGRITGP